MPPVLGPDIALADAFVILAAGHRQGVLAVGDDNKARFLSVQKLFNDHATAGIAEGIA